MKITADDGKSQKTTLNDDAAIYTKRDEQKKASETFKELNGKDKWQFFKDYVLFKLVVGIIITALVVSLLYSTFGPKPEMLYYVAIIDNPLYKDNIESMTNDLKAKFVTDEKKEEIQIDTAFYYISNEYNSRMKFVTYISGATIDAAIFPSSEFTNYLDSEAYADLETVLDKSVLDKLEPYWIRGPQNNKIYALDVTEYISRALETEVTAKYYVACIANSKNMERFEGLVEHLFGF